MRLAKSVLALWLIIGLTGPVASADWEADEVEMSDSQGDKEANLDKAPETAEKKMAEEKSKKKAMNKNKRHKRKHAKKKKRKNKTPKKDL